MIKTILLQLIGSFMTSVTFAVLFHSSKRYLLANGLIGACGWISYWYLNTYHNSIFVASLIASFVLSLLSFVASRNLKAPTQIFFVPGILPVVPGVTFFHAIQSLLAKEYLHAGKIFLDVLYTAVGIACGIAISTITIKIIDSFVACYKKKT